MLKLIFNKDNSFFFDEKLASYRAALQENDAKFRFAILPQGIRQFHDSCKIAKCQTVATLAPVYPGTLLFGSCLDWLALHLKFGSVYI